MAHHGTTSPPDPKGFTCYCPKCEFDAWACSSTVDQETGKMLCEVCGTEFEPEE
jgi:transcription elongation factor Elf1